MSISLRQYPGWPMYSSLREDTLVLCMFVRDSGEEHQLGSDSIYRTKRIFPTTLVVLGTAARIGGTTTSCSQSHFQISISCFFPPLRLGYRRHGGQVANPSTHCSSHLGSPITAGTWKLVVPGIHDPLRCGQVKGVPLSYLA